MGRPPLHRRYELGRAPKRLVANLFVFILCITYDIRDMLGLIFNGRAQHGNAIVCGASGVLEERGLVCLMAFRYGFLIAFLCPPREAFGF